MSLANRLSDPENCCDGATYQKLADKISSAMTRLLRQPENGGNPFLFAYAAPKPHELKTELNGFHSKFTTAATDGRKFYWSPEFLEKLTYDDVVVVMMHEAYHTVFFHCDRMRHSDRKVANIATDYVVNACIEHDFTKTNSKIEYWANRPKDSKSALGKPWLFKDLLAYIDGAQEPPKENLMYADVSLHGRSPESIYDEIMDHINKSPRRCKSCGSLSMDPKTGKPKKDKGKQPGGKGSDKAKGKGAGKGDGDEGDEKGQGSGGAGDTDGDGQGQPGGGGCGGNEGEHECPDCGSPLDGLGDSMDQHIDTKTTKAEVQQDVMRAAQQAKACRGNVPGSIEDYLGELIKPTLKFTDIIRSALLRKTADEGTKNDYKRFRRRMLAAKLRQYLPKRHGYKPRWLCMLDTSGSMGDMDMAYGISQLKVLGNTTEGFIVPNDTNPRWEAMINVKKSDDLKRTKIVGRGGTVVSTFLQEFPAKVGREWDVIVIITDGYIEEVDPKLRPPCDVVWVITSDHKAFKPAFGRVAPLRNERV